MTTRSQPRSHNAANFLFGKHENFLSLSMNNGQEKDQTKNRRIRTSSEAPCPEPFCPEPPKDTKVEDISPSDPTSNHEKLRSLESPPLAAVSPPSNEDLKVEDASPGEVRIFDPIEEAS